MSGSGGERPGRKQFFSFAGAVTEDMESITPSSVYHWQAPHSELSANYHWFRHSLRKGRDTLPLWPALTHIHKHTAWHAYKQAVTLAAWQDKEIESNVPTTPNC